jgi:diguanylate cyclase (GGDEF)-like protein/PAS domain S-box-containing protein
VRLVSEDGATRPSQRGEAELFELAAIGMALTALDGRFLVVNPRLCSLLGHTAGDLASSGLFDITHPDDWSNVAKALADLNRDAAESFAQRQRCLAADGAQIWVDLTVTPTPGRMGLPMQFLAQFTDVTAEVENLQTLHAAARHFQVLSENSTDVVAQTDPQGLITWVSPSVTTLLGWETGLLAGRAITAFVAKPDLERFSSSLADIRHGDEIHDEVVRFRSTTGAYRFMSVTARALTVEGGLVTGMAFGLRDVTEELRAKRELARSEEQFRMAMHGAPEGMAVTDAHDRIVQANPALCELLGTHADRLIGHRFREFIPEEEREKVEDLRTGLQLGELETVRLEHRLLSTLDEVWVDHAVGILRDEVGNPQLFVHQFADRTETRRMQADLTFRATHDIQTGLANRASLLTRLEARLGLAPAPADHIGVLWCDIDNLKQINDQLGHRIGDVVIAAVADRLKGAVRHKDIVGRIGGDEFVIVLDQCPDEETLLSVATNVQKAASGPVSTDIGKVKVTVSLGAVLAASTTDTDDALSRADHALYRAKRAGRDQVAIEPVEVVDPLTAVEEDPDGAPEATETEQAEG